MMRIRIPSALILLRAIFAWLFAPRLPVVTIALALLMSAPGLSVAQAYRHKIAPDIGPYSYFATNCNANASNWSSTVEEAMQSVADNYHAPRNHCSWPITRIDPWATSQQPIRGACGSTHFYPKLFPRCNFEVSYDVVDGIECQNSYMFYTQYTAPDSQTGACTITGETGFWAVRSRTVECPRGFVWDNTAKYCVRTDAQDDPYRHNEVDCPQCVDSVNVAQGFTIQTETDLAAPARSSPLELKRSYSSNRYLTADAGLGRNWRHNWQRSLTINEGYGVKTVVTHRENHNRYYFTSLDQGATWVTDPDITLTLTPIGSSSAPTGWKIALDDGKEEIYDAGGQLISVIDVDGRAVNLHYASGKLTRVVDEAGRALDFSYTGNRLSSVTTPGGLTAAYTYNANGMLESVAYEAPGQAAVSRSYAYENSSYTFFLTGITDENNNRVRSWQYNSDGRTNRSIRGDLSSNTNRYSISYNVVSGNVFQAFVTDPLGQQRTYGFGKYHGKRRVTSTNLLCASCGSVANNLVYNSQGLLEESRDFKNVRTRFAYNARGLASTKTEAYGVAKQRILTTDWHPTRHRMTREAMGSRETLYQYNSRGQLEVQTQRDITLSTERSTLYSYYEIAEAPVLVGLLKNVTAPGGAVTSYEYYDVTDPNGHFRARDLKSVTNAVGHVTEFLMYDSAGQATRIQDPNGVETSLTYHPRGWLLSQSTAGETTSYEYRSDGLMSRITAPDGSFIEYLYDAAGRLTGLSDGTGNRIEYTLDNAGNRTSESSYDPSNALARTRSQVFNNLGQLWKLVGSAGTTGVTTTYAYDANGNQTGISAPLGRDTINAYDEFNRLRQTTDALSGVTQYGYNSLDQLISVTDPRNNQTSYIYNALGDLTLQTSPDTGVTVNTYDSAGNLATSTDARNAVASYTYDALNRVATAAFSDGSTTDQALAYTYDAGTNGKGRLTGVSDANHSLSWTYDDQGRALTATQVVGSVSKTTSYTYANGLRQSMTTPSGQVITYGYTNGKITSVSVNGTVVVSNILYDPFGPVRQWTWADNSLAVRTFDQDGNIALIDSAGLKTYSYDDAFRITGITDTTNSALSWTYGYDDLDRLTSASKTGTTLGYTYDANGNRLTETGSNPSTLTVAANSNRLSSTSGSLSRTYGYDNAGNTTSFTGISFTYNNRGRMNSSTKSGVTTNYIYNALGQLVKKASNTLYYYDEAGHILGIYDGSGALTEEIVWLGDTPIATLRPQSGGGVKVYNIHTDHLNAPRVITDAVSAVVRWRWDGEPFGGGAVNDDPSGVGVFEFSLRFPGQVAMAETGLYYNYFRDYDPATGRYVQSDPIGLRGGLNTYAYVKSNPISLADPSGLDSRAEPEYCFGVYCPPVRPPGGWSEEHWTKEWWEDFKDGASNIGKAIKDWCTKEDTSGCEEEWEWAYRECEKLVADPVESNNWRRVGKRPPTVHSCARGYVSQRCGGNKVTDNPKP